MKPYIGFRTTPITRNAYWDAFLELTTPYINRKSVLEIGASDPLRTQEMRKLWKKLYGLELKFERIPLEYFEQAYVNGNAECLPFKSALFDGVIAHHVIEHILDDISFIQEIHRVLKKDGFAILGTPNRKRLPRFLIELFGPKRTFPWWEHEREYVKEDLTKLLRKANVDFRMVTIHAEFIGICSDKLVLGFRHFPLFESVCSFWFIELRK